MKVNMEHELEQLCIKIRWENDSIAAKDLLVAWMQDHGADVLRHVDPEFENFIVEEFQLCSYEEAESNAQVAYEEGLEHGREAGYEEGHADGLREAEED